MQSTGSPVPRHRRRTVAALAATVVAVALAPLACRTAGSPDAPGSARVEQERTVLRVENRSFLDMVIYVLRGGQRLRLGTAPGNSVARFTIPPRLIFGATSLQFVADPVGAAQQPVSESIVVSAGDEVVLLIPPH